MARLAAEREALVDYSGPVEVSMLTSVASWYQSPLSTVGRRRTPPCYARPRLRGLGPETLSMILARTTDLTILLAIMIAPNRALPGDPPSNVPLRS